MRSAWKSPIYFPRGGQTLPLCLLLLFLCFYGFAQAATIYLPLINKAQNLQNGDFETVPNVSWTEANSYLYPLILDAVDLLEGITPQGGNRAVWLVGDNDEISALSQTIYVPTDAAFLNYFYWIRSDELNEYCGVDQAYVRLGGTTLATYALCETTNTNQWVQGQIDLSTYRGRTVELIFGATTDNSFYSDFFLDSVSLSTITGP